MKQTAVEWFFDNLKNHEIQAEHLSIYEKAKEMEKEQIEYSYYEAWTESDHYYRDKESILKIAEQYYNETFEK